MRTGRVGAGRLRTRAGLTAAAVCALATGGVVVCASSDAVAQTTAEQSNDPRVCMDRAMTDFRAGNFRPALQNFQRTFDLTGNPAILFNIAVTLQRLGEPGEAARALRRYLVAQPQAPNRADVEQQIRTLEEEETHLHPSTTTTTSGGNTATVSSSSSSSPPPPVVHQPPTRSIIGPVAVTAVGGAALVAGIVFLALREVALGELRNSCTIVADVWHCDSSAMNRYNDAGTFTAVGLTAGIVGVLAVAGGITWLVLPSRDSRRDTARIGFGASANGAAITFGGTF